MTALHTPTRFPPRDLASWALVLIALIACREPPRIHIQPADDAALSADLGNAPPDPIRRRDSGLQSDRDAAIPVYLTGRVGEWEDCPDGDVRPCGLCGVGQQACVDSAWSACDMGDEGAVDDSECACNINKKESVLFILDASSSMAHDERLEMAKLAIGDVVAAYPPVDFSLLVFPRGEVCSVGEVQVGFDEPAEAIYEMLGWVQPMGGTPLAEALDRAHRYLIAHAYDRSVYLDSYSVILVSDGGESCAGVVQPELQAILDQGVKVFLVDSSPGQLTAAARQIEATGRGGIYVTTGSEDLLSALRHILRTITPQMDEVCDEIDNNCDGRVDETLDRWSYGGPPGTEGVGQCRAARHICQGGHYRTIEPEILPSPEICDGTDNDCDGEIDEGFPLGERCWPLSKECAGQGWLVCAPNRKGVVCSLGGDRRAPEICDGTDNDCDGLIDEGDPKINTPCDTGRQGICARGTVACSEGQRICRATAAPQEEVCDGRDNDCDGQTDHWTRYSGPDDTEGVGDCHAGVTTCTDDQPTVVEAERVPSPEICNGVDDDCNGEIDDDLAEDSYGYSGPPSTLGVGRCQPSIRRCVDAHWMFDQRETTPQAEECNRLDDDCDGEIDEDFGAGARCEGIGRCRRLGRVECTADGDMLCSSEPGGSRDASIPELCSNFVDDDCDGETDEIDCAAP